VLAACDRLALIATKLGLAKKAIRWRSRSDRIHRDILHRAWSNRRKSFVSTFGINELDASLLLLAEHIDPSTGEQWGNYVQTYSMVGLINSAIRLSIR
jgi:GH15 family glucan-1,4-alpha-glucosidase